ncbi:DUF1080 domain-containing protein [Maribacter sp. HTCC2170]|uniref:3-keto-disaccharide hydrolase n=1 Tax=Maribacter sp. (strain HTCC2170 / KCCM 42371) TaxID=313603 RepID=UPI00006B21C1|nr:DUF1080 domain-containing protein [Maribacter sp. HTCC2170]EAR00360.1 probable large multifunctional protein-putative glycosyl hydrolase [Maribacter sp. HTCC2170]
MNFRSLKGLPLIVLATVSLQINAQNSESLEGRWNLTLSYDGKEVPSWLEVGHSGLSTLVGRFVFLNGSARPISEIQLENGEFSFEIPPQWEEGNDLKFKGKLTDGKLNGTLLYTDGKSYNWVGTRSPKLTYNANPVWGESKALFNGKNLDGWQAMGVNQWMVKDGILTSEKSGANLVSSEKFNDFKLHIVFRYPEGSNSGVYLRGRYEVQIADNIGLEPSSILFGGIYGFLTPNEMVAKPAGEWQEYDITLIGRRVTIIANGKEIITNQNIPGMTGGALDNKEAEAGPFLIQGDHGPVEFRTIEVTPIMN